MNAATTQIIAAYRQGMTPEEIAESLEYDITAVKAALMQSGSVRKEVGSNPDLDFSDEDVLKFNEVIKEIAFYGDDDHLRLKAAMYGRDDFKGRRDAQKQIGGLQLNVVMINDEMKKARAALARSKSLDITTESKVGLINASSES